MFSLGWPTRVFSFLLAIVLTITTSMGAFADEPKRTYAEWVRAVTQARSANASRTEKAKILREALQEYRGLLMTHTGLGRDALAKKIKEDEGFRKGLFLHTHPYRDLYSEIHYLASSMVSDGVFDRCNDRFDPKWLRDQALTKNILEQREKYRASCEGSGYSGTIFVGSRTADNPDVVAAYPLLFANENVADLLRVSEVLEDDSIYEAETLLGKKFPAFGGKKLLGPSAREYREAKRAEALKEQIYDHAMVNSLKTKGSLSYFFEGKALSEVRKELETGIDTACRYCDATRKKSLIDRALNGILSEERDGTPKRRKFDDRRNVVVALCNRLIDAGYYDYYWKKTKFAVSSDGRLGTGQTRRPRLKEVLPGEVIVRPEGKAPNDFDPRGARGDAQMFVDRYPDPKMVPSQRMDAGYDFRKFVDRRLEIYQSVVKEGSTNLLFLTHALSERRDSEKGTEYLPKLACTQSALDSDALRIDAAITEAKGQTDAVIADLNKTIQPVSPNSPGASESNAAQFAAMIEKNPTAVGQAMADRPHLAQSICDGLNRKIHDDLREQTKDEAILWGVTIVGTTLTLTGVGTGVGLELLLATGMLASSATLTAVQHAQSEEAKELAEIYRAQFRGGQSENERLLEVSEEQVREYQSLKVGVGEVFGIAVDSVGLVGSALKASMTVAGLARLVDTARASAKEFQAFSPQMKPLDRLVAFAKGKSASGVSLGEDVIAAGPRLSRKLAQESSGVELSRMLGKAETTFKFDPTDSHGVLKMIERADPDVRMRLIEKFRKQSEAATVSDLRDLRDLMRINPSCK